jgi:ankyrin repeat protein
MDDFLNSVADEIDAAAKKVQPKPSDKPSSSSSNIGELLRQASRDESMHGDEEDYDDPFDDEPPQNLSINEVKSILQKSAKIVAMEDAIDGKYNLKDAVKSIEETQPTRIKTPQQLSDSEDMEDQYSNLDFQEEREVSDRNIPRLKSVNESDDESELDEAPEDDEDFDYEEHQDFLFCCYHHQLEAVEHHLDRGANRLYGDRHGWTALHWACAKGYDDIAHILLKDYPDNQKKRFIHLKEKTAGMTPLHVRVPPIHPSLSPPHPATSI